MFGLFVYVYFRLWSHWVYFPLFSGRRGAPMSCWGHSTAVRLLALGYLHSFLVDAWLLKVSAVLRYVIRIDMLATSTRSICKSGRVWVVEIPLFYFTLVTNHDVWILSVGPLPSMKNRNTHRIYAFTVISWSFDHGLRQGGNRIRIRMINISLIDRLLHPSIHFNFCISALCLLLTILIVFHMHILLYFAQVLLRLRNHRFQLRWSKSWSILHIWEFQNISLTTIRILVTSL